MSVQIQVNLRTRKLGVLIRDARLKARKTLPECAKAIGVTPGIFRAYEEGRRAPSLPELEVFAFSLGMPVSHFWGSEISSDDADPTQSLNLALLAGVRQRIIGALLKQQRMSSNISIKEVAEQTGISAKRLAGYELGERPIPFPELEVIVAQLGGKVESFMDHAGVVGKWMNQQKAVQEFLQLPAELQDFVCKPVNRPYLELAIRLSGMSTEKLRSVAEGLLDITL